MYGLIGKKLGHSFSADFFNEKFKREGIDNRYYLFEIPSITDFPTLLKENPQLEGLNVTIPYKQEVIPYLDSLSEEASEINAVNVIKFIKEGDKTVLKGYNSDCIGFKESLEPLLHPAIRKGLILGTGGASKAVAYVLNKLGIGYKFVSRNPQPGQFSYEDLDDQVIREHLLIVNTTPLGMYPAIENCPPIPYQFLTKDHICYDLVYNPEQTLFMKLSKEEGATVKNGLEMLYLQAIEAWRIWNQ